MTFLGTTLYGNFSPGQSAPSLLGTINFTTAAAAYVGPNLPRMDALEFAPIPEPTSLALVGVGALFAWRIRRRCNFSEPANSPL
jgi:hypothetical protein